MIYNAHEWLILFYRHIWGTCIQMRKKMPIQRFWSKLQQMVSVVLQQIMLTSHQSGTTWPSMQCGIHNYVCTLVFCAASELSSAHKQPLHDHAPLSSSETIIGEGPVSGKVLGMHVCKKYRAKLNNSNILVLTVFHCCRIWSHQFHKSSWQQAWGTPAPKSLYHGTEKLEGSLYSPLYPKMEDFWVRTEQCQWCEPGVLWCLALVAGREL